MLANLSIPLHILIALSIFPFNGVSFGLCDSLDRQMFPLSLSVLRMEALGEG